MIKELRFTESIVSPKEPKGGELMSPLFRYNAPALLVEIIISSLSLGKPKVSSFFNTVDINIFSPNKIKRNEYRQQYFKENELVIGLIARYHPVKGHDSFIKAVSLLRGKINGEGGGFCLVYICGFMNLVRECGMWLSRNYLQVMRSALPL